jgi:alanyl-tRNA synthetase
VKDKNIEQIVDVVIEHPSYKGIYTFSPDTKKIINDEIEKFRKALDAGLKQINKGADPFTLFTSYGLPLEIVKEVVPNVDEEKFKRQMEEHQQLSRAGSSQKFKN